MRRRQSAKIEIYGIISREPEFKRVKGDELPLFKFSVAVVGNKEQMAFNVVAWRGLAEQLRTVDICHGDMIGVTGNLSISSWRDRNGNAREKWTVNAVKIKHDGITYEEKPKVESVSSMSGPEFIPTDRGVDLLADTPW